MEDRESSNEEGSFAVDTKQGNDSGQLLSQAFASTSAVLAEVRPGQLELPTPCASWQVRDLIDHFIGTARWSGPSRSNSATCPASP
jgi:hypothetical protein